MNRSFIILTVLLFLGALLIGGLIYRAQQTTSEIRILRLPHTMPSDHPVHLAMEFMAQRVKEKSGGKMVIQIYPNGLLGDGSQIKELMQLNVVDIGKFSACDFEDNIPEMAAMCLPYLFRDSVHYWNVLNSPLGDSILDAGYNTRAQLKGLCFYDAGARSFYSNYPISNEAELANKKVRVMVSALMVAGVEAMGAVPTSMAWGELFTALQTGTVDAAENNIPSFYTSKHYEVCKHFVFSEHFRTPDVLAMNCKVWDALTPAEQAILSASATESVAYQRKIWDETSDSYIQKMEAAGVEFLPFDQASLHHKIEPFYEQLRQDAKTNARKKQIMSVVDAIQAM